MTVYQLVREDLTHLGGPMGSEYTTKKTMGIYNDIDKAKSEAQKDYGKMKIIWKKKGTGITSGDLNWVMYHIITTTIV